MKKIIASWGLVLVCQSSWGANDTLFVGNNLQDSVENVAPAFHHPSQQQEEFTLSYAGQPPMIPHSVKGYQANKNVNQCLQCHNPESARMTGATPIPASHFSDRQGNISKDSSPRRYFCLQCHVPQANVKPIVANDFTSTQNGE